MASESIKASRFSGDTQGASKQSSRSKTIKSVTVITVDNADEFLR